MDTDLAEMICDWGREIGELKERVHRYETEIRKARLEREFIDRIVESHEREIARYERNRSRALAAAKRRWMRSGK
jgi:hypothetical protein